MSVSATPVRVIEETPAYWRAVFDYPPFNILDATIFECLQDLLVRMYASQRLRVVVFESANPDFYLAHFDLTGKLGNILTAVGPSGLPILMDTFVRLTKSSVVSIAKIRGCVRGASSEFVLACDMRFGSRENTRLGQPEVAVGLHPGGGGTERLPPLVGRGRALEIILSGNDFDGDRGALFVSHDAGDTWEQADLGLPLKTTIFGLAVNPNQPDHVFCSSKIGQVFRSSDCGKHWLANSLPHGLGHVFALAAGDIPDR